MKIAWICHFSNAEVRKALKLSDQVHSFAPWITNTIKVFENNPEHELHVIAPHRFLKRSTSFETEGVHYHFFNPGIPFWGRQWPSFFRWDLWTGFKKNNKKVGNWVNAIKPDVIHLQGAENAYYSSSIFQFQGRYPIVVNLQRMDPSFYYDLSREAKTRRAVEEKILKNFPHFSIRTQTMEQDLLSVNPNAQTHWVRYHIPQPRACETCPKQYDLVFFARVSPSKGIEDLLRAAGTLTGEIPGLSLCIIGGVSSSYREYLNEMAAPSGLRLVWKGLLPEIDDVHKEACKARVSVLPTHQDIIPGTIVESMQLGIPVVSYKVGSIPELNAENESLLLVEKGDIQGLAVQIKKLLTDEEYAAQLAQQAQRTINKFIVSEDVLGQHIACYTCVMEDFHK
ncbi:MAG: glycosyltransferase family 4 protein [Candidatus Cloacimonadaceae bacterium]|jgi:glycosyltransferase involved in cell wall biosynthesis|nr:glycosyltransferase family 4 protein [Candidatus Cloacimonadota bacterium]MDX9948971.1 glycosyltransferase family 4 protein [Candidatus Syntrophosphaera sp.]